MNQNEYWDWLPAFRWGLESQEVELPSSGLLSPTILLDGLSSIIVWASSFIWRLMLWAVKAGVSSDLMEEAGRRVNNGAASLEPAVMTGAFALVIVLGLGFLLFRLSRGGERSAVLRNALVSLLCMGMLIGVVASSRISASEMREYEEEQERYELDRQKLEHCLDNTPSNRQSGCYPSGTLGVAALASEPVQPSPRFMSAGWLLEKPSEMTTALGASITELMEFADEDDGLAELEQDLIEEKSPLDCQYYIAELNRRSDEVAKAQELGGWLDRGGQNIASAMSDLWVNAAYNTFAASQFGSSPLSASVYCRYLEAVSDQDPGMQLHTTVDAAAGPNCNYDYDPDEYLTGWERLGALEDKSVCKIDFNNPNHTQDIWLGEWAYKILVGKPVLENIGQEPIEGAFKEGLKYLEEEIIKCGGYTIVEDSYYPKVELVGGWAGHLRFDNFRIHLDSAWADRRWEELQSLPNQDRYRACLKLAFFVRNITIGGYGTDNDIKWKHVDADNGADRDHGWGAMSLYICGANSRQIEVLGGEGGGDGFVGWLDLDDGGYITTQWVETELWNCLGAMAATLGTATANKLGGEVRDCTKEDLRYEIESSATRILLDAPCYDAFLRNLNTERHPLPALTTDDCNYLRLNLVTGDCEKAIRNSAKGQHIDNYNFCSIYIDECLEVMADIMGSAVVSYGICSPVACRHDGVEIGNDKGDLEWLDNRIWDWNENDVNATPVSFLFHGSLGRGDNESHSFADPFSNAQPPAQLPEGANHLCHDEINYPSVCRLVYDAINAASWMNIDRDNWAELPRLFSSLVLSNIIPRPSTTSEKLVTKEYEPGGWFTEVMDEELYARILSVESGTGVSYSPTLNDKRRSLSKKVSYSNDNEYSDDADIFRLSEVLDNSYVDGQNERPDPSYVPGALSQIFRDPVNHGHALRIAGFWAMCRPETTNLREVAELASKNNPRGKPYQEWRNRGQQRDITNHYWDLREDFYDIAPIGLSQTQSNSSNEDFEGAGKSLQKHFDEPWGHVCASVWTGAGTIAGVGQYYCSGGIAPIQKLCEGFNAALAWLGIGREPYVRNDITDVRPLGGGAFQLKPNEVVFAEPTVSFLAGESEVEFGISPAADAWLAESGGGDSFDRLTAAVVALLVTVAMFMLMGVVVLMVLGVQTALLVGFSMLPVILLLGAIPSERTRKMLKTFIGILGLSLVGKVLATALLSVVVLAVWFMTVMAFTAFSGIGYKWAYLVATIMSCALMIFIAKKLWKGLKEVVDRTGAASIARSVGDTWGGRKVREGVSRGRTAVQDRGRRFGRRAWEMGVRNPVQKKVVDPAKEKLGLKPKTSTPYKDRVKQDKADRTSAKQHASQSEDRGLPAGSGGSSSRYVQNRYKPANGNGRRSASRGGSSLNAPGGVKQPEPKPRTAKATQQPPARKVAKPDGQNKKPESDAGAASEPRRKTDG